MGATGGGAMSCVVISGRVAIGAAGRLARVAANATAEIARSAWSAVPASTVGTGREVERGSGPTTGTKGGSSSCAGTGAGAWERSWSAISAFRSMTPEPSGVESVRRSSIEASSEPARARVSSDGRDLTHL
jgi:hypothetical protein